MKTLITFSLIVMFLGLAGCSKSGGNIDTSKVQAAFQNAPPVDKAQVQTAISEVKAKNYAGALTSLQKVVTSVNLTPDQKNAVQDLITQVQNKGLSMGHEAMGAANDMTNKAGKAMEDAQKTIKP